jgi:hypothetical protein
LSCPLCANQCTVEMIIALDEEFLYRLLCNVHMTIVNFQIMENNQ